MRYRIRHLEHGTLVVPRVQLRFVFFLLVVTLALLVSTAENFATGNYAYALFGGVLILICARLLYVTRTKRDQENIVPLWIVDDGKLSTAGPRAPVDNALCLRTSQIRRIRLGCHEHQRETHRGCVEATIELQDSLQSYPIYSASRLRTSQAIKVLDNLAQRWNTTVEWDASSLTSLRKEYGTRGAIAVSILSLFALAYGAFIAYTQWKMLAWPKTAATVTAFEPGIGEGMHWYANPSIAYVYRVGEVRFGGNRLNPSPWNYQRQTQFHADTALMRKGAVVSCWYDPDRPEIAYVLNSGVTVDTFALMIVGAVGIGWSLFYARTARRCDRAMSKRFGNLGQPLA